MSHARYIVGDTRDVTASLPDGSVDLVLTSPPFLALRSYLPADHPDKHREIGSEATPAEFLQVLLELAAEWRRVLAPHGSIAVELGDTYAGSGGAGGDYAKGGLRDGQEVFSGSASRSGWHRVGARGDQPDQPPNYRKDGTVATSGTTNGGAGWPLDKSLCGIPHLFHLSLAYGRNLLTGVESPAGQWRVRNVVAWCRPNPPVGALGDKVRPATSYMTIACPSRTRYFDLDAVRTEAPRTDNQRTTSTQYQAPGQPERKTRASDEDGARLYANAAGAPPLDHWWIDEDVFDQDAWLISTQPYKGSHYATWPEALCDKPILSMVPPKVCLTCGEPSRRIVESSYVDEPDDSTRIKARPQLRGAVDHPPEKGWEREHVTTGWSDCGHDNYRRGIVLDPFAGSGTTLKVATHHGRDAIGIDLDPRNVALASDRVGMFLTVEMPDEARPEGNRSDDPLLAEGREGAA